MGKMHSSLPWFILKTRILEKYLHYTENKTKLYTNDNLLESIRFLMAQSSLFSLTVWDCVFRSAECALPSGSSPPILRVGSGIVEEWHAVPTPNHHHFTSNPTAHSRNILNSG